MISSSLSTPAYNRMVRGCYFILYFVPWVQLPLSHCCASLQTVNGRNTVTEDLFLTARQVI